MSVDPSPKDAAGGVGQNTSETASEVSVQLRDSKEAIPITPQSARGTPRSRRNSVVTPMKRVDDSAQWRSHAREIMGVVDGLEQEDEVRISQSFELF